MMLHQHIRDLAPGGLLKVIATDPSTRRDIPKFCVFLDHELVGQQEEADLRDVRAGRDVDQVFLVVGVELVRRGEIVKARKDFLKVPGVALADLVALEAAVANLE